eukprot:TRINITY_DN7177_c0_g1_i2.p1 TRINITY_DN7177_c0_g1~~TRINITY_DN7177_c0_g1_i2.p1  ORF type:complete len:275 (-),score=-19.24 TRINITY_DN7177_c0_g1_i2:34-858(-)
MAELSGKVKLSHVQTYDVTLQEGTPYRQLVQREDSEEKAERAPRKEYRRALARDRREASQAWHELPEAFEFRLAGEGEMDGHSVIIIEAVPREGYQPRSRPDSLPQKRNGGSIFTAPTARLLDGKDLQVRESGAQQCHRQRSESQQVAQGVQGKYTCDRDNSQDRNQQRAMGQIHFGRRLSFFRSRLGPPHSFRAVRGGPSTRLRRRNREFKSRTPMYSASVSYTHLTLPTICSVQISVVAGSSKKKTAEHNPPKHYCLRDGLAEHKYTHCRSC